MVSPKRLSVIVALFMALAILSACGTQTGASSVNDAASRFVIAAAAGDVAGAQSVSKAPVSETTLRTWRERALDTSATADISAPKFAQGMQTLIGASDTKYFIFNQYVANHSVWSAGDSASEHQIGIRKIEGRWFVVTYDAPSDLR